MTEQQRRDSIIGWSIVALLVGVVLIGYLASTWA
jgi:hypothetical protein